MSEHSRGDAEVGRLLTMRWRPSLSAASTIAPVMSSSSLMASSSASSAPRRESGFLPGDTTHPPSWPNPAPRHNVSLPLPPPGSPKKPRTETPPSPTLPHSPSPISPSAQIRVPSAAIPVPILHHLADSKAPRAPRFREVSIAGNELDSSESDTRFKRLPFSMPPAYPEVAEFFKRPPPGASRRWWRRRRLCSPWR